MFALAAIPAIVAKISAVVSAGTAAAPTIVKAVKAARDIYAVATGAAEDRRARLSIAEAKQVHAILDEISDEIDVEREKALVEASIKGEISDDEVDAQLAAWGVE